MVAIKKSKPISQIKKGDKIKIDGRQCEVDAHYVLIDHGTTKEMAIEVYDPKAKEGEGEGQIRYFNDQAEDTLKYFELENDFLYGEKEVEKVEW